MDCRVEPCNDETRVSIQTKPALKCRAIRQLQPTLDAISTLLMPDQRRMNSAHLLLNGFQAFQDKFVGNPGDSRILTR